MLTSGNKAASRAPVPSPSPGRFTPAAVMAGSTLFQDYRRAFVSASGMAPDLRSPHSSLWAESAGEYAGSPCVRLGLGRRSCAACLFFHQKLAVAAEQSAVTRECHAGLCETAVPVRTGNRVVALLQIGQVRLRAPTDDDAGRVGRLLSGPRSDAVVGQVKAALWRTRYIAPEQYASLVQLLEIFSRQLAEWYVRHAPTERPPAPLAILRAKEWIEERYHEPLTLTGVAKIAEMSPTHFCRSFHNATGTTFRTFLGRTRIAHVCQLLADPHNTIAETAFAVGFQSISQFNRIFRKLVGQSPSEYRAASIVQRTAANGAIPTIRVSDSPLSHPDAA